MKYRQTPVWIALGILTILLAVGVQRAGAYEYDTTYYVTEYADHSDPIHTSTRWEDATASSAADEYTGECSAGTHTFSEATRDDAAAADAVAHASFCIYWTWDGPPGTAPGGVLVWEHDGQGWAAIEGDRGTTSATTHAEAHAGGETHVSWGFPTGYNVAFAQVGASVDNSNTATWDPTVPYCAGNAEFDYDVTGGLHAGWFDPAISWWTYDNGGYGIPEGTTQPFFTGYAAAACDSAASVDGQTDDDWAFSQTYAGTLVRATAEFNY